MADDEHDHDGGQEDRLDRLEATQAEQGSKLDAILDKIGNLSLPSHQQAEQHEERRLDRASTVAEEVQRELAKAKADEARQAADDEHKSEHARLAEERARLAEAKPAPPPRPLLARIATGGWNDR